MLDVLPEYDSYAIDVLESEFSDSIGLVFRLRGNLRTAAEQFPIVSIEVANPLE
jgi:hypothetical protein